LASAMTRLLVTVSEHGDSLRPEIRIRPLNTRKKAACDGNNSHFLQRWMTHGLNIVDTGRDNNWLQSDPFRPSTSDSPVMGARNACVFGGREQGS